MRERERERGFGRSGQRKETIGVGVDSPREKSRKEFPRSFLPLPVLVDMKQVKGVKESRI